MDTRRLVLLVIFSLSLIMLWEAWNKERLPKTSPSAQSTQGVPAPASSATGVAQVTPGEPPSASATVRGEVVEIRTDVLLAKVNSAGGTLEHLELLKHRGSDAGGESSFVLLGPAHRHVAQIGLTGEAGPNHRSAWQVVPGPRDLAPGADAVELRLRAHANGVSVDKVFRFRRDSYRIDVTLEVRNTSDRSLETHAYYQLTHDGRLPEGSNTLAQTFGAQSYLGFAGYSAEKKFEKFHFSDIDKAKPAVQRTGADGWLAFVQHYFVSAWLPTDGQKRDVVIERRSDGQYAGRILMPIAGVAPGATAQATVGLYAGPQEQRRLKEVAPGFDLVVDYGWLAIIAWPLFWLLEQFHGLSGNWGVAIILLTLTIKLVFYPLSAASYRSMAKMKLVAPRLTRLREMHGNDRNKMNQAMMELYRTEKINPLGGCFPILVQIPVFIALYWVLLAAIELRNAPFVLWIKDLSALDPYYVLPALMTATMVLQTKMNPKPPDPVQAKVMAVMPWVFSIFFFFFPAGLVLYWLINNILSILQQWQIQRMFDKERPAPAKR